MSTMPTGGSIQPPGTLLALARLLSSGRSRPRQELAAQLDVSHDALASCLTSLHALGVNIVDSGDAVRLQAPLDLLDAARLRNLLRDSPDMRLEIVDECDSTNAWLAARPDAASGTALACEHQRAGRGRRGRAWTSGLGGSLTFSLLWRFAGAPAQLSGLPLAVAVIIATELECQGVQDIALKWPNDLLHQDRKLGGILVEMLRPAAGHTPCIIGIGLNVRLAPGLAAAIDRPVTDLARAARNPSLLDRTTLLAGLLRVLAAQLPQYQARGLAAFRDEWLRRHAHQGRHVRLTVEDRVLVEGEAQGIAEDGALLVRSALGVERVLSGEVSLR